MEKHDSFNQIASDNPDEFQQRLESYEKKFRQRVLQVIAVGSLGFLVLFAYYKKAFVQSYALPAPKTSSHYREDYEGLLPGLLLKSSVTSFVQNEFKNCKKLYLEAIKAPAGDLEKGLIDDQHDPELHKDLITLLNLPSSSLFYVSGAFGEQESREILLDIRRVFKVPEGTVVVLSMVKLFESGAVQLPSHGGILSDRLRFYPTGVAIGTNDSPPPPRVTSEFARFLEKKEK